MTTTLQSHKLQVHPTKNASGGVYDATNGNDGTMVIVKHNALLEAVQDAFNVDTLTVRKDEVVGYQTIVLDAIDASILIKKNDGTNNLFQLDYLNGELILYTNEVEIFKVTNTGAIKINGIQVLSTAQPLISDPTVITIVGSGNDTDINYVLGELKYAVDQILLQLQAHGLSTAPGSGGS